MANLLEFRTFFSFFSYNSILLISMTVLEIFRLTFQKTQFFTLKIQDGRRNYGEMGHFEEKIVFFFFSFTLEHI